MKDVGKKSSSCISCSYIDHQKYVNDKKSKVQTIDELNSCRQELGLSPLDQEELDLMGLSNVAASVESPNLKIDPPTPTNDSPPLSPPPTPPPFIKLPPPLPPVANVVAPPVATIMEPSTPPTDLNQLIIDSKNTVTEPEKTTVKPKEINNIKNTEISQEEYEKLEASTKLYYINLEHEKAKKRIEEADRAASQKLKESESKSDKPNLENIAEPMQFIKNIRATQEYKDALNKDIDIFESLSPDRQTTLLFKMCREMLESFNYLLNGMYRTHNRINEITNRIENIEDHIININDRLS